MRQLNVLRETIVPEDSENEEKECVVKKAPKFSDNTGDKEEEGKSPQESGPEDTNTESTDDEEEEPVGKFLENLHVQDTLRAIKDEEPVFQKVRYQGQKKSCYYNMESSRSAGAVEKHTNEAIKHF